MQFLEKSAVSNLTAGPIFVFVRALANPSPKIPFALR